MRKRAIAVLLILFYTVLALALPAAAEGTAVVSGKSTLTLQYSRTLHLSEVPFHLHRVGTYNEKGDAFEPVGDGDTVKLPLPGAWTEAGYSEKAGELAGELLEKGKETGSEKSSMTDSQGEVIFTGLEPGLYLVWGDAKEIGETTYTPQAFLIPLPYPAEGGAFIYTVKANVKYGTSSPKPPEKYSITVHKDWRGGGAHPDSVTVQLFGNGEAHGGEVTLSAGSNWEYTWTDIDHDPTDDGWWSVQEKDVPAEWKSDTKRVGNVFIVTNTYNEPGADEPEPIEISVQKKWEPAGADHPDSVTVQLLRDGKAYKEETLNIGNDWKHTWTGLALDSNWDVKEKDVPDGYTSSIEQGGDIFTYVITNTRNEPAAPPPGGDDPKPGPGTPGEPSSPGGPGPDRAPAVPEPPALNTEDHFAYLIGYEDDTIRPDANITRAEAVTIFFRLLAENIRDKYWSTANPYPDVERAAWYNNAISTMTNMGIIDGYLDGTFRPNANITRAELTKIAVSFFRYTDLPLTGSTGFDDVPQGRWYTGFIEAATELGLIEGYPDNTFRPEKAITRAETVTIINRAIGRKPHRDGLLEDMITWPDNMDEEAWYYADIQEATNSHDYQMNLGKPEGTYERWTALRPVRDWAALERMWADLHAVYNPGEVMDKALPNNNAAGAGAGEKREEDTEE